MARLTVNEPERLAVLAAATLDFLKELDDATEQLEPDTLAASARELGEFAGAVFGGDRQASTRLAGAALMAGLTEGGDALREVANRLLAGGTVGPEA